MKKIILIGGGTFSTVVIDAILENDAYSDYTIDGILDDNGLCNENYDYPHLGKIEDIYKFASDDTFFVISIGSPKVRSMIAEKYADINYLSVIDKTANISGNVKIGKGSIILKGTIINAFTQIGDFTIVNAGAIVDHHCTIGSYSHVGQGTVLWHSAKISEAEHLIPGTVVKG
jgi:NDP-sugar pyrophosphorylase family protein